MNTRKEIAEAIRRHCDVYGTPSIDFLQAAIKGLSVDEDKDLVKNSDLEKVQSFREAAQKLRQEVECRKAQDHLKGCFDCLFRRRREILDIERPCVCSPLNTKPCCDIDRGFRYLQNQLLNT